MNEHKTWMKRALRLAEKGGLRAHPNPRVGAVVVHKGKVRGEGYHAYFGGPHAEVTALRKAGRRAKKAILYVTLEPCSTWGKTPPCVDTVIASGVKEVVIGSIDPNPLNHYLGVRALKKAGIRVRVGILAHEVERQNQPFFKAMRTGYPYVTLKMAQSLDGKIATKTGRSRWISSKASRDFVHRLRTEADALLVGKNTALQDNPRLQARNGTQGNQRPWRVVLDPNLELPSSARVFRGSQLTLVAISEKKMKKIDRLTRLSSQSSRILIPVPEKEGRLGLKYLLQQLVSLGVNHLLVEGGGEVAWSLLSQRLVDRLIWIVAPKIIGGRNAKTSVEGEGIKRMEQAFPLVWEKAYQLGDDWVLEART